MPSCVGWLTLLSGKICASCQARSTQLKPYSLDPRIKMIKQQEKEAREAKKAAAGGPGKPAKKTKAQEEEDKKVKEEENRKKEEEEKVRHHFVMAFPSLPRHSTDIFHSTGAHAHMFNDRLHAQKQRNKRRRLLMLRRRQGGSKELQRRAHEHVGYLFAHLYL